MVRDAFPLLRIDEALQAVHSSNWFSSFQPGTGVPTASDGGKQHKKTAFRTSSMSLYEFTHLPFGLSNVGSSFCYLIKQCFGD